VHWGQSGAAGFLFRYVRPAGEPTYLLQQRAKLVDFPGTWGIPGGAIRESESPEAAARREALEEVGSIPAYRITGFEVQNCGGGGSFMSRRQKSNGNSKLSPCEKQMPRAGLRGQKSGAYPCTLDFESGLTSTKDLVRSSHLATFPFMRKSMYKGVILMCSSDRYLE
jgi:8-oxo-dGTP pyrophosphatase MutT (NUDIX family)